MQVNNVRVLTKLYYYYKIQTPGVESGDLILVLQQEQHDTFERKGDNLVISRSISLTESLCGFQFVIRHLDGRSLVISSPPGKVIPTGIVIHFDFDLVQIVLHVIIHIDCFLLVQIQFKLSPVRVCHTTNGRSTKEI